MAEERIHIDSSDWSVTRGWLRVPVALDALPDIVRRAIASSDRFSIFELDAAGAILASRSTFTFRALRTNLRFEADGPDASRVLVRCQAANIVGPHPGIQARENAVSALLDQIAAAAAP